MVTLTGEKTTMHIRYYIFARVPSSFLDGFTNNIMINSLIRRTATNEVGDNYNTELMMLASKRI